MTDTPNPTPSIRFFCTECGSTDLWFDAWVAWNEETQAYEFADVCSDSICNNCGRRNTDEITYVSPED